MKKRIVKVSSRDVDVPVKDDIFNMFFSDEEIKNIPKKKNKNIKKVGLIIIFLCLLVSLGFSSFKLFKWNKDNLATNDVIEEIDYNYVEVSDNDNTFLVGSEDEDIGNDYWYYINFPLISVDFNKLVNKNADTVAWINVNNTNINYPVVQAVDNDYYLNRSYDKSYNEAGWVFMDFRNNSDLDNKNTILYAHSRLNKTMFGSLSKTLKNSWYTNKDNHIIRMSTPNENALYQIFSVYVIKEESYYINTSFESDSEYLAFLNTLKSRSKYDFNTNLDSNDNILTLSTCYSDTERTVVHAKLIKKEVR